jgi:hypothetical protein
MSAGRREPIPASNSIQFVGLAPRDTEVQQVLTVHALHEAGNPLVAFAGEPERMAAFHLLLDGRTGIDRSVVMSGKQRLGLPRLRSTLRLAQEIGRRK